MTRFDFKALENFREIPILPQNLVRVVQLLNREDDALEEIVQVILSDQGLSAMVLREANALSAGAQGRGILTVSQSAILLGLKNLSNIFQSITAFDMLNKMNSKELFDLKKYWNQNLCTAFFSRALAEKTGLVQPEEAYVAGLLHNIGELALHEIWPKEYEYVLIRVQSGGELLASERSMFGYSHQEAGEEVGKNWKLPPAFLQVFSGHHRERWQRNQKSGSHVVDIVYAAQLLAVDCLEGTKPEKHLEKSILQILGIQPAQLENLFTRTQTQWTQIEKEMQIGPRDLELYARILEKTNSRLESVIRGYEQVHSESKSKISRLELQRDSLRNLVNSKSAQEATRKFMELINAEFSLEVAQFLQVDWEKHRLQPFVTGFGKLPQVLEMNLLKEKGLVVRSALEKRPLHIVNANSDQARHYLTEREKQELPEGEIVVLPMVSSFLAVGVIYLQAQKGFCFSEEMYHSLSEVAVDAGAFFRHLTQTTSGKLQKQAMADESELVEFQKELNRSITETTFLVNNSLKCVLKTLKEIEDSTEVSQSENQENFQVLAKTEILRGTASIDDHLIRISETLGKLRLFAEREKPGDGNFVNSPNRS